MTPERWRRVEELFAAAKELSSEDLDSYLRRECGDDHELEREVVSLLDYHHSNVGLLNEDQQPWQGLLRNAAEPPTFTTGATFGPYLIRSLIGSGGMGVVYLAEDTRLHRMVALKVLPSWLSREGWRVARFTHEALAASALNHPNVPVVYENGEIDQRHYIASEYVDGSPLSNRISQGVVPWREAIGLTLQAASALQAAHAAGIVHRDVKPGNILVGRADGRLKLVDFGIAKLAEDFALQAEERATLTAAGAVVGTPGYMAPEQAAGIHADGRSDIWSLAAVLHEMVTGRTPTPGSSKIQVSSNLPATLAGVLERALQPDPDKRYPVIAEFAAGLDHVQRGIRLGQHVSLAWIILAVAAAAGIAGAVWGILHHPPIQPRTVVRWTYTQSAAFFYPALSRDGTRLAMIESVSDLPHLSLRMMDEVEGKPIPGSEGMYEPEFSPDGRWIAAFYWGNSGPKLKKIPVAGGTAITLTDVPTPLGLTWGDDDTIVFSDGKGLLRVSSAGGAVQSISTPDKKKGETRHSTPHFLPGARALLFTIGGASSSQVALLDLRTGRYRVLVNNGVDGRYVPSGHLVYARGSTLFAAPFDIKRLAVTGPEAPVIHGLSLYAPYLAMAEYAFSDSGLLVYMEDLAGRGFGTNLAWVDRQGQVQNLSDPEVWGPGRLSPDGRRVATEIYSTQDGIYNGPGDIWVFELERRTKTRLTFGGTNICPIWTPDGRRITFGASSPDKHGIYSVKADGSAKPELLVATDSAPEPTSWSPDGKSLLYQQVASGKPRKIWALPVSDGIAGRPVPLHDSAASESDAQISPDGRWVAYVSRETGQKEVYIHHFPGPGGKEPVSTQGGYSVRWSRDGRELFYRSDAGLMAVDIQTSPQVRIGLPKAISRLGLGNTLDTAPDGQHFLVELLRGGDLGGRMQGVSDWFEELRRRVPVTR